MDCSENFDNLELRIKKEYDENVGFIDPYALKPNDFEGIKTEISVDTYILPSVSYGEGDSDGDTNIQNEKPYEVKKNPGVSEHITTAEEIKTPETIRELFFIAIKQFVHNLGEDVFDLQYISIRKMCSVIISKKNHAYYPPDFVSEFYEPNPSDVREYCELNVTLKPVRVVISTETFKASFQLHQRELNSISNSFWFNENENMWQLSEDLLEMLEKVREVDDGQYQICCGLTKDELGSRVNSPYLNHLNCPHAKHVALKCEGVFRRRIKNHSSSINSNLPRCKNCMLWLRGARKLEKRTAKKQLQNPPSVSKTDCHSNYAISKLTPKNREIRISNIRIERKNLVRNLKLLQEKYAKLKLLEKQADERKETVVFASNILPDNLNDDINVATRIAPQDKLGGKNLKLKRKQTRVKKRLKKSN